MRSNSKQDYVIKEIVRKIEDEDIRFLHMRLSQRIGGDLAESLILIQDSYQELHHLLSATPNAEAVYEIVDVVEKSVQEEWRRRFAPPKVPA